MDTNIILQYLQIFALSALSLFIFSLLMLSIYALLVVKLVKSGVSEITKDVSKLISFFDDESHIISRTIRSKIESINIEKVLFGSSVLGGIIAGFQNAAKKSTKTKK